MLLLAPGCALHNAKPSPMSKTRSSTNHKRTGVLPPGTIPIFVDYDGAQQLFGLTRGFLEKTTAIPRHPVSGKKTLFKVKDLIAFIEQSRSA